MDTRSLAEMLIESSPGERPEILRKHSEISATSLAEKLQEICYEIWTNDPQRVTLVADTADLIAQIADDAEVRAYADWINAIKALVNSDLAECIEWLDRSEAGFLAIDRPDLAAKTQPSKLYALALLGRYDEAVAAGIAAREVFVAFGDQYSAGKIEHNIGNLYWRRDLYREAEPYLSSAHARFASIGDQRQLAMVENCQAFVKTLQNQFREAETIYQSALDRAEKNVLTVTQAEIEIGLSNLYLFEGRYDLALKYLEAARTRYEVLEMPNQSANCELEIADIYLELNLLPEAVRLFKKTAEQFSALGMQAELARCSLDHARALIRQEQTDGASPLLDRAERLYVLEGNRVAAGSVHLARSQMLFDAGDIADAKDQAVSALDAFRNGGNLRLEFFTRWLLAEITAASGDKAAAETELTEILEIGKGQSSEISYLCHSSLGRLTGAEQHFAEAIELVESSRSSLASEELRTTFFASRILPYDELVKLNLSRGQFENALLWHERARSRVLSDRMQSAAFDLQNDDQLGRLREELNWLYNRIKRSDLTSPDDRERTAELRRTAVELEKSYATRVRRLRTNTSAVDGSFGFDLTEFRSTLGDIVLVEFTVIEGRYTAFVVNKDRVKAFFAYADEAEVNTEVRRFLFQIKSGRVFNRLSGSNQALAMERLLTHSRRLFDLLLAPLGDTIDAGRIVFAPAGLLHYLPFHALYDGMHFLAERTIISYTPGASILDQCLRLEPLHLEKALVAGVEDPITPMVRLEIDAVSKYFSDVIKLIGKDLTEAELRRHAEGCGVIHLACHGRFRPDNPGFSSISLFAEEMTVNEVFNLPVANSIIVLSACESGLNEIVRGEELVGLTSAFLAAGASTLILSLWRVDDAATVDTMTDFYSYLTAGRAPAESLAAVQRQFIRHGYHPYFWSPFIVSGRG